MSSSKQTVDETSDKFAKLSVSGNATTAAESAVYKAFISVASDILPADAKDEPNPTPSFATELVVDYTIETLLKLQDEYRKHLGQCVVGTPRPKRPVTSETALFYKKYNTRPGSDALYKRGEAGYDNLDCLRRRCALELGVPEDRRHQSRDEYEKVRLMLIDRSPKFKAAVDEYRAIHDAWSASNVHEHSLIKELKRYRVSTTSI